MADENRTYPACLVCGAAPSVRVDDIGQGEEFLVCTNKECRNFSIFFSIEAWCLCNDKRNKSDPTYIHTHAPRESFEKEMQELLRGAGAEIGAALCNAQSKNTYGVKMMQAAQKDTSPASAPAPTSELADLVQAYGGFDPDLQDCCMSIMEFCWDIPPEAVRFINRVMELPVESRRSVVDAIQKRLDLTSDMEDLLEVYSKEEMVEVLKSL